MRVLAVDAADFEVLLSLNEAEVPHVNAIDAAQMQRFVDQASAFFKVVDGEQVAGFVISLTAGEDYASPNYRWFEKSLKDFLYIDRIIVNPAFRRQGVARLIYAELAARARRQGLQRLCCEVNLSPPNPDSVALHRHLGFVQQSTQVTGSGAGRKEVSLLVKELVESA